VAEIEELLVDLILDRRIQGHIDQVTIRGGRREGGRYNKRREEGRVECFFTATFACWPTHHYYHYYHHPGNTTTYITSLTIPFPPPLLPMPSSLLLLLLSLPYG